ncbi:40S ribosomal protein S20 [Anaeramoeba flamelloides]|uniref:Small ribosomal subunit protein uS10 n=1 Tax=Anaeramoeba flamelloides TaxID=1746091 RepID=A0AAV7YFI8_9EUKA|nr:40S ribosomal protein S20 [Anaeramoeba flamelloides]KAJ3428670.1 40S ribosomal protein S20 [Anaeramoeba flamelloides]KAJ3429337.1 40S ribosomal protein S20 [Anaeramoeba flamelloides]KAJ3429424.1 40S ribosomal protein S20 [Anaeramoeba flamelloides]KAJ3438266.1 40S ribosomal protein S20 [Anaeramoeba flamelloides]|eukprot:Anaeramoba_flamelloidesa1054366_101.p3 GENE.a1054366_101~~a1054366_101.p3  ORF type:complete len:117 (+),score=17.11 a1054366_101:552-902(+)
MSQIIKKPQQTEQEKVKHIRITLSGTNVLPVEKVSKNFIDAAKEHDLKVKGPIRLPTKRLCITTRKSPCGEGTKTWDRFEMRIYKRIIDLYCQSTVVKRIARLSVETGVDVEVTIL